MFDEVHVLSIKNPNVITFFIIDSQMCFADFVLFTLLKKPECHITIHETSV